MKAALLFRISAVVLLLFAVLHTIGFLRFVPPTPEGVAVRDAMDSVQFTVKGATYSYGHFYRGFGLFITAELLLEAVLAWALASMARRGVAETALLGGALTLVQIAGAAIAWKDFGVPQVSFCVLLTVLLGTATMLAPREPMAG